MSDTMLPTVIELTARAEEVYGALRTATCEECNCAQRLDYFRRILEDQRQEILLEHADDPKRLGANEAAREASLRSMTLEARQQAESAERALTEAKNAVRVTTLDVELARFQLRLLEVLAAEGKQDKR